MSMKAWTVTRSTLTDQLPGQDHSPVLCLPPALDAELALDGELGRVGLVLLRPGHRGLDAHRRRAGGVSWKKRSVFNSRNLSTHFIDWSFDKNGLYILLNKKTRQD